MPSLLEWLPFSDLVPEVFVQSADLDAYTVADAEIREFASTAGFKDDVLLWNANEFQIVACSSLACVHPGFVPSHKNIFACRVADHCKEGRGEADGICRP